jgi:hypothetical protein
MLKSRQRALSLHLDFYLSHPSKSVLHRKDWEQIPCNGLPEMPPKPNLDIINVGQADVFNILPRVIDVSDSAHGCDK